MAAAAQVSHGTATWLAATSARPGTPSAPWHQGAERHPLGDVAHDTPAPALACSPIYVWCEIAGLSCQLTAMADTAQNTDRRRPMVYTVHIRDGS
uniref:HrpE3 n=1 Tax=Xanthomonas oryzae pv. oryzicola TaxID=129394 RepID=Q0VHC3_XANOQ|nr:HrpE3 [Xanthomonas oryzae pv. oryzicola]